MRGRPKSYARIKKVFFLCAHKFLAVPHKNFKMHTWNILAYFSPSPRQICRRSSLYTNAARSSSSNTTTAHHDNDGNLLAGKSVYQKSDQPLADAAVPTIAASGGGRTD
jgi:hypothetical protein